MFEHENAHETDAPLPRLLPGETLIKAEEVPLYIPTQPPSSLRELERLAQVKAGGEVGAFGPALASVALERSGEEEVSAELRKYEVLFGRDSLRVAIDVMPMYPLLAHATIHALAELQGITYHDGREEEPGRIIHENRAPDDPIATKLTKERGWEWPYYATVDATPLFMHTIYLYAKQEDDFGSIFREKYTGRDKEKRTIADAYKNALDWLERRLEANPEGILEYKSPLPNGMENQVWRDSWDSYSHADGTLANREYGVASTEVQQLAYDALSEAAVVYEKIFGDTEKASELRDKAEKLRQTILETFWVDEKGGYFALGTDRDENGDIRQLKVRTSNMGHLLRSRLLVGEEYRGYREATIWQLFSPEMLNVSGIRTLANDEVRFRPGAYQNGSVWLWDTYYIAEGLRYHGYYGLANFLADKIHTAINVTQKFPEYVRGDDLPIPTINTRIVDAWDENVGRINRIEQPPQEVQAWSVAAEIARDYYSGRVPDRAYEARAVQLEDAILRMVADDGSEPLAV
jgi:glycogen debranching enzyme